MGMKIVGIRTRVRTNRIAESSNALTNSVKRNSLFMCLSLYLPYFKNIHLSVSICHSACHIISPVCVYLNKQHHNTRTYSTQFLLLLQGRRLSQELRQWVDLFSDWLFTLVCSQLQAKWCHHWLWVQFISFHHWRGTFELSDTAYWIQERGSRIIGLLVNYIICEINAVVLIIHTLQVDFICVRDGQPYHQKSYCITPQVCFVENM